VTTKGGRALLKKIPGTAFRGGQVLGKVVGGEDPGLSIKEGLVTAGLIGAGAIVGKNYLIRPQKRRKRWLGLKDFRIYRG